MRNVLGQHFGSLVVIEELKPHITPNGSKQRIVRCRCSCGNVIDTRLSTAKRNGKCKKCRIKDHKIDLSGQRFGRLVVIEMADDYISPAGHHLSRCKCKCDCGNICIVNMSALKTKETRSCGCLHNTRGLLKDNKQLMSKYDFDKNKDIKLESLTMASNKKVWWKCAECGNSWPAAISSQTDLKKKHGCPYCSGRLPIKGKTDLLSQKPEVVNEWDYEKNLFLTPEELTPGSSQKVWWKCSECGHSWKQTVANRVQGSGCPKCNMANVNSFCEQAVFYYVRKLFPDAVNGDKHIGMELDIFIPSRNIAIEYDGEAWHKSLRKTEIDDRKSKLCNDNNIELIRIREPKLDSITNCRVFVRENSLTSLSLDKVITDVLNYLVADNRIDVNTERDTSMILEQFATKKYKNSLAYNYPDIAKEWHPYKNGKLTPDKVNKASRYIVWWLGKCGHEYPMIISARTRAPFYDKKGKVHNPQGCPYCAKKRAIKGVNDLLSKYPEIASEWNPSKNGSLKPDEVLISSKKNVWWLGRCGHEWQETIINRIKGTDCPLCKDSNDNKKTSNNDKY